ncbi:DUF3995 domain-containing protein [Arthrobacter luteolus]|uniref:DUF3995 domain-containing protein n=1 Tax=Arthrobacter luteolus TaxID=98672 RepID=UPI00384B9130
MNGTARTRPAPAGSRHGVSFLWAACILGLVHAGFSVYWAVGGEWLLATVGRFAVQAAEETPVQSVLVLGAAALSKAATAVIPLAAAYGRFPFPRLVRALSWAGGAGLILYGGVNTAAASAVLAGWIPAGPNADIEGLRGHALLWDPLFLAWGASLLAYLWLSRRHPQRPGPGHAGPAHENPGAG